MSGSGQTVQSVEAVRPSHLLYNALLFQFEAAKEEDERWLEERLLMSAVQEATRELLLGGRSVLAEFDWVEDDYYFSPEVSEEILAWESVDFVQEKVGSRLLSLTERGFAGLGTGDGLDINSELSSGTLDIIRGAMKKCLQR